MALTYLTFDEFKLLTVAPSELVDAAELAALGWTQSQLENRTAFINARLAKRYAVPFSAPYPNVVKDWLARLVTFNVYRKRDDVGPNDRQFEAAQLDYLAAEAELKEAADAQFGLFDLPLRADTSASGISKGAPLSYSEQSPYVFADSQVDRGKFEDESRRGTES